MSNIDNNVLRPWLERMKQGDFEAAQEIFARFNDQIYRTVYFLTRNKSEVKRVVRRRPILTIGIALIVLAVIAGFTSYTWIRFGDNRVQVEVRHTAGEALSSEQSARIHQRLVDVQSQLGNGESAVVYLPEIIRIFPEVKGMELLLVSNPEAATNYEEWDKTLTGRDGNVRRLPNGALGLDFVRGQKESYFGGAISPEALKLLPEMKSESEAHGSTDVWRRVDEFTDMSFPTLTSIYRNPSGDEIFISTQWFNQKGGLRSVMGATELEKIEVDGIEVQYRLEEPFIFTETNRLQSLQWIETFDDRSLLYTVGTPSLTMTKEALIAVMKGLQAR